MAIVSILIPAHRTEFVREAIASALAQSFQDIEVLVGDNTQDGALERIVNEFGNPKLKYFHHGFDNGGQNAAALWEKASGRYVKWLFYDDVLMPNSVEVLLGALKLYPQSPMAFHERVLIDASGAVVHAPPRLLGDGQVGLMDRSYIVRSMIPQMNNFIGEPSFTMLDKSRIDVSELSSYKGHVPDFLGDVTAFFALASKGPIAVVGGYFGAFRKHGAQESASDSPIFPMGLIEWEVFLRGEAAEGNLTIKEIFATKQRLEQVYAYYAVKFPELQRFAEGLPEITDQPARGLFDSATFQANVAHAREVTQARIAMTKLKAA